MNNAKKELERLARVISYGVLDTQFERGYDDLVKLAATICGTRSAAISLVDESRIWFKARFQVKATFVPRAASICGITVKNGAPLSIPDLTADPRTAQLPAVLGDPHHRAYLGVPLLTSDGYAIGTLAVLDEKARLFTPAQIEALQAIARQVITQLDLSAANRKLALSQENLSEERERFKNIVEDLNEVVFRADIEGRWTYLNPAWSYQLGLDAKATLGESIAARVHPADKANFSQQLRGVIEGSAPFIRPHVRMTSLLGEEKIFEIFVKHCRAIDGSPFLAGTLTDLTQLLSAHAKSIEQEHYINSFYSSTGFFMGLVEILADDILMVSGNPALEKKMLGDSNLKLPATGKMLGMPRASIDFWREKYLQCLRAGGRSSFDYQEADGTWYRVYLGQVESAQNELPRFSYIVADVSEEVERLRTIDSQRRLLETISEHAGDVIWMAELPSGDIVYINKAYERIWGSSREALLQDRNTFLGPIHPEDRARVLATMPNQARGTYEEVYRVLSPSGERWVRDRAFPVKNAAGEVVQLVGIASDVTEERLQEEALRNQKENLELVISHLPIAICVYDAAGKREFVNEEWSRCLGWSSEEVVGAPADPGLFLSEEMHREAKAFREQVGSAREFTLIAKDKSQKILLVSVVPLPQGKKMTTFRDLTHARSQEKIIEAQQETMIESARLSSLGEMAAGIAHEINNPLAIIQGSADLVISVMENGAIEPAKLQRSMERISSTVNRIAKIIAGLKSFARDGSRDPFVPSSLKSIVGEALELCQSRYRHNGVELHLDLPEEDVLVAARPVQLAQLLVNLLNNAFDAVEAQAQKKVYIGVKMEGGEACLRVLDNGPGIAPELRDKILQPFFTTKAPGKGTGLGLSLSRSIVEGHGGRLLIKTIGGLTCFEAALPPLTAAEPKA